MISLMTSERLNFINLLTYYYIKHILNQQILEFDSLWLKTGYFYDITRINKSVTLLSLNTQGNFSNGILARSVCVQNANR